MRIQKRMSLFLKILCLRHVCCVLPLLLCHSYCCRVFSGEEEPKAWNNSYEVSDHLNGNGPAANLCLSLSAKNFKNAINDCNERKENDDQCGLKETSEIHLNEDRKNLINVSSSNASVLSLSRDFINNSFQKQNTKMCQIENSVEITLYEYEKYFQTQKVKNKEQGTTNLYSFSLEDHEKEAQSILCGEKTIDFMRDLRNDVSSERKAFYCKNAKINMYETLEISPRSVNNQSIEYDTSKKVQSQSTKLGKEFLRLNLNFEKSCKEENMAFPSMFENDKPIFTQTIAVIKDWPNLITLHDTMNISNDILAGEIVQSKNNDTVTNHLNPTDGKTEYYYNEIPLEKDSVSTGGRNIQIENINKYIHNSNTGRKTSSIDKENISMIIDQNLGNHITKTLYFNKEMPSQNVSSKITKIFEYLKPDTNINCENSKRRTEYFSNKIFLQNELNAAVETSMKAEKYNTDILTLNPSRKTLYFNHTKATDERIHYSGKSICGAQGIDMTPDEVVLEEKSNKSEQQQSIEHQDYLTNKLKFKPSRETLYFDNEIDQFEETQQDEKVCHSRKSVDTAQSIDMTLDEVVFVEKSKKSEEQQIIENEDCYNDKVKLKLSGKTLYFDNEIYQFHETLQATDEKVHHFREGVEEAPVIDMTLDEVILKAKCNTSEQQQIIENEDYFTNKIKFMPSRKTLYFENEIVQLQETLQATDEKVCPFKKGVDRAQVIDMTLDEVVFEKKSNTSEQQQIMAHEGCQYDKLKFIPSRKTLYFDNEIDQFEKTLQVTDENVPNSRKGIDRAQAIDITIEEDVLEEKSNTSEQQQIIENEDYVTNKLKFISSRKTLYFDNEINQFDKTLQATDDKVRHSKKCVDRVEAIDMILDEIMLEEKSNTSAQQIIKNEKYHNNIENLHQSNRSLHRAEDLDVASENLRKSHSYIRKHYLTNLPLAVSDTNKYHRKKLNGDIIEVPKRRGSIYTPERMDLTLDGEPNKIQMHAQNIGSTNNMMNSESVNSELVEAFSNPAKFSSPDYENFAPNDEISLNQSFNYEESFPFSESTKPLNDDKTFLSHKIFEKKLSNKQGNIPTTPANKSHSLFCTTPSRLSLLEFKELEKNIALLSVPKKKQSRIYDDLEETRNVQSDFGSKKNFENNYAIEMSGFIPNESELHTPPKERKSRIPISISSAVWREKSFSLNDTSSNNQKEVCSEFDIKVDNLTESIQLMRRALTFSQKKDTISQNKLESKFPPVGQISVFERNAVTLSDVSVFLEGQRIENSNVTQREIGLSSEKTDSLILNRTGNVNKALESRFINLTLEDLDKTRLSLVHLSYEDDTANVSDFDQEVLQPIDTNIQDNISDRTIRRLNLGTLRNISPVCRKCRRCQKTLVNETSTSTFQSFLLPELPTLPDIGLDRLQSLRKRPTIQDSIVFLARLSLDCTISSDNSSQITAHSDAVDYKNNTVKKCIKDYEQDMKRFEMDLIRKCHNARSGHLAFVLRLDNLLRKSSSNWIFDYQMQFRGIIICTHKKMLTFTLSLAFVELNHLGHDINLQDVNMEKSLLPKKNWKPIDFFLEFQLKLNLPYHIQSFCKSCEEDEVFIMLQKIDQACLATLKMGNALQKICYINQAFILRDGGRTIVRKIMRRVVNGPCNEFKYVEKTIIKVELLNLKTLSFKNILSPQLHNFHEEIQLLPTGLEFLQKFLPNPLNYLKDD